MLQSFTTPAGVPVSFVVSRVGVADPTRPSRRPGQPVRHRRCRGHPCRGGPGYDLILFNTTTSTQLPLVEVAGTSYVPSPALIVGDSYQWSLKSFDNIGDVSGSSLISQFPVITPGTTGSLTTRPARPLRAGP